MAVKNKNLKTNAIKNATRSVKEVFERNTKALCTEDITKLSKAQLDALQCGDVVVKITKQNGHVYNHTYIVSYKEYRVGICLTYTAAGLIETHSYDYSGNGWVYNSKDTATVSVDA